jgi:hypothetical protein
MRSSGSAGTWINDVMNAVHLRLWIVSSGSATGAARNIVALSRLRPQLFTARSTARTSHDRQPAVRGEREVMQVEKKLLNEAVSNQFGIAHPKTDRQRAAAAWLHAEGYGIWFAHDCTPHFTLHASIKRNILRSRERTTQGRT